MSKYTREMLAIERWRTETKKQEAKKKKIVKKYRDMGMTCNNCEYYDVSDGICKIDGNEQDFLSDICERFEHETDTARKQNDAY